MNDERDRAEEWVRELEAVLGAASGLVAGPLPEPSEYGAPASVSAARLVRHAEDLLVELCALTPSARTAVQAELEATLTAMPPGQRSSVVALRRDLAMVDGVDEPEGVAAPAAEMVGRLATAWLSHDWVALLGLLRAAPSMQPEAKRAYARGRAWTMLGYAHAAVPFFEHAARVADDPMYFGGLLDSLHRAGRTIEAADLGRAALERGAPLLVELAAVRALFVAVSLRPAAARAREYEALLAVLDRVLGRSIETNMHERPLLVSLLSSAHVMRGFVLGHLERHAEAGEAFDHAVDVQSASLSARVARGMHRVVHGGDARADLEMAVRADIAFVPPYLFLANLHLAAEDYAACQRVCERALEWPSDPPIQAALRDMLAIALMNQHPPDLARAVEELTRAVRLAPDDARIRANLAGLKGATEPPAVMRKRLALPELAKFRASAGRASETASLQLQQAA